MNWYLFVAVMLQLRQKFSTSYPTTIAKNEKGFDVQGFLHINNTCDAYKKLHFSKNFLFYLPSESKYE